MNNIIYQIKNEINQLQLKLIQIQNNCSHPKETLKQEYKSNTGNWCKQDDSYWVDKHCLLCDKKWSEDQ